MLRKQSRVHNVQILYIILINALRKLYVKCVCANYHVDLLPIRFDRAISYNAVTVPQKCYVTAHAHTAIFPDESDWSYFSCYSAELFPHGFTSR